MRKGQIYFNWIFIVVVGAIMLTFFVGFAVKYKDLQEKKTEIVMLNNLDTALTNLQSSSFTTTTHINLPLNVNVGCKEGDFSISINEKNEVSNLLASKSKLKDKMYIWYQPYEIPFRVANFYYLIDDEPVEIDVRNDLYEDIMKGVPELFKDKIINRLGGIPISGDINIGNVDGEVYIGREMLYVAIFSDNYVCFKKRVERELRNAIDVYTHKASKLSCPYRSLFSELNNLEDYDDVLRIEELHKDLVSGGCDNLF